MAQIETAAHSLGFGTRAVRIVPAAPALEKLPLIALLQPDGADNGKEGHFVVIFGAAGDRLQILDYPNPPMFVPVAQLARHWDGVGLSCR